MQQCDRQLERFLASLPTRIVDIPTERVTTAITLKAKKERKNEETHPQRADRKSESGTAKECGVDLTSIDGFNVITAQTIISEIGTDMSGFRTENHFTSWLGLTPSHDVSGGKIVGPGRRKVQNRVAMALRMAATTLLNSKSYLGGRYRHLRKQLPSHAAAVKAMARYLAVLVYRMLTHGQAWVDRGAARFEQRRTELELTALNFKAKAKGFKLVPITEAT